MQELISIIVPVYKVEKYIHKCIDSILSQTYENIELILVEDGSPDGCGRICDEYAERDARVRVIHQKNAGLAASRNIGVSEAKGEYLLFVDGDDHIEARLCETAEAVARTENADAVCFGYAKVNENGGQRLSEHSFPRTLTDAKGGVGMLMSSEMPDYAWNKLYRRRVHEGVEWTPGVLWEDIPTTYRLFMNAQRIAVIPEPLYCYRQREGSITARVSDRALEDIFSLRYARYLHVAQMLGDTAELGFRDLMQSALALYDRSVWSGVNIEKLAEAQALLSERRSEAEALGRRFRLYYSHNKIYRAMIRVRHGAGKVIRGLGRR